MNKIKRYSLILTIIVFYGCSESKIYIIKQLDSIYLSKNISITKDSLSIAVPLAVEKKLKDCLKEFLYSEELFQGGDDLILQYKFTRMKKLGLSDAESWGNMWERQEPLDIEITFLDKMKNNICSIGILTKGSKLEDGAERAAYEIAEFAATNFLKN